MTDNELLDARLGWIYPSEEGDSVAAKVSRETGVVMACESYPDDILRPVVRLHIETEMELYEVSTRAGADGKPEFFLEHDVLEDFRLDYLIVVRRSQQTQGTTS